MPVIISGSTGISGTDGSAATPAVQGTDTNTGMFFPAADTIAFAEGGTEAMRIDASGNVGIGTSSPRSRLDLAAGAITGVTNIGSNANSSAYTVYGGLDVANGGYLQVYGGSHGALPNTVILGTNNAERVRIDSNGNMALGVTSISVPSGVSRFFAIGDSDTGIGQVSDGILSLAVNGTQRLRVADSGVTIGGTAVNALLTVDGNGPTLNNIDFAFYAQSGGAPATGYVAGQNISNISIWASGRINALEFNARSDRRLKADITPIPSEDAFRLIESVPAVHYKWKGLLDDGVKFGFIAQDLVKAGFSNLVGAYQDARVEEETDADGLTSVAGVAMTVNYDQIIPVLAVAIKELKAEVDALKARIAALEAR